MTDKRPVISFCIPTYNRCNYLEETLKRLSECLSEAKVSKTSYSIIISDNCSDDRTKSIVTDFGRLLSIKYILQKENIGPARNLLESIKIADGEFIWILSDDDLLEIRSVKNLLELIKERSNLDYIFCPRQLCDKNMLPLTNSMNVMLEKHLFFDNGYELFVSCNGVMPGQMGYFSSTIIRRELWNKACFNRNHSEWIHLERLLFIIKSRPCAIMSGIGVSARVGNYRKFSVDSYVWLDSYVNAFIYAIELGYCEKICKKYIKYYLENQQKSYFGDMVFNKRFISYKKNALNLGINSSYDKSIWYWLSFTPCFIMPLFRYTINIIKYLDFAKK